MKISLFQGIVLGVCAVAALAGLIAFATYSGSSSGGSVGAVTIWGTLPAAQVQAALTEIAKTNTALKGITYVEKDSATFDQDVISSIATGAPPGLILISQEDLLSLSKFIDPIPSTSLSVRTFQSAFTSGSSIYLAPSGSGAYGVPYLIDPLILYDNRAILSSAGVAQPPSTWEALTGLVPQVATQTAGGGLARALIALGTYANVDNARGILSTLFLQTGVPISTLSSSAGTLVANLGLQTADNGTPAGQAVLRFYTQFSDSSKLSYTWNSALPDSQSAFVGGEVALYLGYASEASYLRAANPNLDFDAEAMPQPAAAPTKLTYGKIYAFALPHGGSNPSGAYAAAAGLVGQAADQTAASATGLAPALSADLASPPSDPIAAVAYSSALYARGWLSPAPASVDPIFSAMITSVTSGRSTLSGALGAAQGALNAVLQQ